MHTKCIAKHIASGYEKSFDNVSDRSKYVNDEIRSSWVFFFRAPNGYEYGHE
jgi:hypothetical protein